MAKKFKNGVRAFDDGSSGDDGLDYIDTGVGNGGPGYVNESADAPVSLNAEDTPSATAFSANQSGEGTNLPNQDVSLTYQGSPSSSSSGSGAAASGVGALLKALGLGGGNTSNTALVGALTGLLSAAGTAKANSAAGKLPTLPTLPGNTSAGYGPTGGYGFQNYAGANAAPGASGLGYAPVQQVAGKPAASYYTYGQGPQQQQFQQVNGGAPITPITQMARGGHVSKFAVGGAPQFAAPPPAVPMPQTAPQQPQPMGQQPPQQPAAPMSAPQRPPMPQMPQQPQQRPQTPPSFMAQRMAQARGPVPTPQPIQQQAPQGPMRPSPGMPPQMARPMATGGFVNGQMNPTPAPAIGMAQSQLMGSQPGHGIQVQRRGPAAAGHTPGMASGGALSQPGVQGTGVSRHITGPGDGTSDSIPARLANGEYVIDAQAVSMLGNGDNSAGAKRLDEFRKNLRQHKGGALAKGKMAPDAKPVDHYMGGQ